MYKKGERIVAKQLLYLLNEKQEPLRFIETFRGLCEKGWFHTGKSITENYRFLIKEGKVAHIGLYYALVQTREDGTRFCVVKDPVERTVELSS